MTGMPRTRSSPLGPDEDAVPIAIRFDRELVSSPEGDSGSTRAFDSWFRKAAGRERLRTHRGNHPAESPQAEVAASRAGHEEAPRPPGAVRCSNCGSPDLTRLPMVLTDGSDVLFVSCGACEAREWLIESDGTWTTLPMSAVRARPSRRTI